MTTRQTAWAALITGAVVVGLPAAGRWLHAPAGPGCDLDGAPLVPAYCVRVVDDRGGTHLFCCVACAEIWLRGRAAPPRAVAVTDEEGGGELDASEAWYVRSSVVTMPVTGNRVHVFRNRADAQRHADAYSGTVLARPEAPFR